MSKSLFEYYKECFTLNYANFNGRARRSEFWGFVLFNVLILVGLFGVFMAIAIVAEIPALIALPYIYSLVAFVPNIALVVRRLHDIGKSGWYYFVVFIPLVGPFLMLAWCCQDSQPFENEYGPNPKDLSY